MSSAEKGPPAAASRALVVAAGILLSRLAGLVRGRVVAHFFGTSAYADVLQTALRAPNALQVLLGEGTLSASFIPVYARLTAEGKVREASRFAGAVLTLLTVATAALVLVGVAFAKPLVAFLTPGYLGDAARVAAGEAAVDRFPLAVAAVALIFPMAGFLVLSAWPLGVLNSHRKFLLSYAAPVVWNLAIIGALLGASWGWFGEAGAEGLLRAACWGALAGGALQLAVQLPSTLRLLPGLCPSLSLATPGVREALSAFGPAVAGRGVVQVAGYLDLILASLLSTGAVAALANAQQLYLLPVSLFGMSVAASELPELARSRLAAPAELAQRVRAALAQVSFLVVPTTVGYLAFGLLIVGALFATGRFGAPETRLVTAVLGGYTLGLPASTWSRLLQNTFFALGDTRKPARIAVARVVTAAALALPLMFWLDKFDAGGGLRFGAAGLTLASAAGAWLELTLLRRALASALPEFAAPWGPWLRLSALALGAALPAALAWWLCRGLRPLFGAALVLTLFGALYLAGAHLLKLSEAERWLRFGRRE